MFFNECVCTISAHLKNDIAALQENYVELDLNYGFVRGYSPYIDFLESPTTPKNKKCSSQAVIKIDFSGKYKGAKIFLEYGDKPRLWSLDISDSPTGDGYGGDNGTTSNMAEVQIHNKQLRIYGNSLPGYLDASSNGGLLLQLVDNIVKKGTRLHLDLSDERLEWTHNGKKQYLESKFLFTLTGQDTQHGEREQYVYIGFNRVVHGAHRHGSGLCHVAISLYELSGRFSWDIPVVGRS